MFKIEIKGKKEAACLVCDAMVTEGQPIIKFYRKASWKDYYPSGFLHEKCALPLFDAVVASRKTQRDALDNHENPSS